MAPCVSIYLSIVAVETAHQRLLRVQDLIRKAEGQLGDFSTSADQVESWLAVAWRAIEKNRPLQPAAQGLAIFMSSDFLSYSYLRGAVVDRVMIAKEFSIRGLLPVMPQNHHFFVLSLSQKRVRLYEGSAGGMRERVLRKIPKDVRDDFLGHSFQREYQLHTASSRASAQKGAIFHGPSLDEKDRVAHFLGRVERGVAVALKGQQAPLILAGVDYLVSIYRNVNTYAHLADDAIGGSPDQLPLNELFAAAWKIVGQDLLKHQQSAFAVYREHANTPLTASNLGEILSAAQGGRIRFLFVAPSDERWGSFISPTTVHVHEKREAGDTELLNLAAVLTIRNGGQVFVATPGQLGEGADATAVFRFALASSVAGAA
jgi:hypothetical protein